MQIPTHIYDFISNVGVHDFVTEIQLLNMSIAKCQSFLPYCKWGLFVFQFHFIFTLYRSATDFDLMLI